MEAEWKTMYFWFYSMKMVFLGLKPFIFGVFGVFGYCLFMYFWFYTPYNSRYIKFTPDFKKEQLNPGVVIATSMAMGTPWLRRFEPYRLAMCSGWMQLRGARRRRNADMGFVMSDHADWQGLNEAVLATGAENVYVTHGYKSIYAKWLRENYGLNAIEIETQFEGESIENESSENGPEQKEVGNT